MKSLYLCLLAACLAVPSEPLAQATVAAQSGASIEMLQNLLQEAEASGDLDEANKSALLDLYRRAISLVEQRRSYEASSAEYSLARESAPRESAALRRELEGLESGAPQKLPDSLSHKALPQLEQLLLSEKSDLAGLTKAVEVLRAQLDAQPQRARQLRERLNEIGKRQTEILDTLQLPAPETRLQRLNDARRWALENEWLAVSAEIEMLNQELLSQPMRSELLLVRRDRAVLELNRQSQYVELLESLVAERRRNDAKTAQQAAQETERQAFGKHSLLQDIAQQNTRLGEELNDLAASLEQITNEQNVAASLVRRIAEDFRLARQKLEIAGLNEALGQVLLEQRRGLPDAADFRAAREQRRQLVIDSSLRQIRHRQERARLRDINVYVEDLMAPLSETWRTLLQDEIRKLAELRRDLLDKAIATDDTYLQALGELDLAQRELADVVNAFTDFLDERLLWVRTGDPPSWETFSSIAQSFGIFVSADHWLELGRVLLLPERFPWILLFGVALFAWLMKIRPALQASLQGSGRNVGQLRHDRYIATIRALLLTLVLALPWPVLFTAMGLHLQFLYSIDSLDIESQLSHPAAWTGQFVPAIGAALSGIALYYYYFVAFRIFCEPAGLAIAHFGWNSRATAQLRRETRRLMSVFLPAAFLLIASVTFDPAALASGLSRLFFVIVLIFLARFFWRVLAPSRGVLVEYYNANPGSPLSWVRYLWPGLGVVLPLMLAVLATAGYVYTAAQFGERLVDTAWLIVAIILIHQLVVRWVLIVERRLAFKDALQRHRAQRAARKAQQQPEGTVAETAGPPVEESMVDYGALGEDTKKLISTALTVLALLGLWFIWSDVLPAFRILDEVSLWSYSAAVDGIEKPVPVTLKDVVLCMLIVVIGIVAARRLPALMEIALLSRLNITAGGRYAISTLTQYAIVAISIMLVFGILGGSWGEIQWLVAALGVGIGFGLQEIVANFISGLILLFERPIRIGDIVTVGDTSGVVTRIRIRSTTIRNWDQKELVVPNKEFITGRLLNWTLSDSMTRIVIPVGIAYGSDVGHALRLVSEIARDHPRILDDPESLVTFENFGDNTLNIVLRCYIDSMDFRLQTQSELNEEINRRFADAGIVIAFPQRDVHLDTSQPLDLRIHRVRPEPQ